MNKCPKCNGYPIQTVLSTGCSTICLACNMKGEVPEFSPDDYILLAELNRLTTEMLRTERGLDKLIEDIRSR